MAPSGSLWLSQALSGSPNLLTKPLLGSQGPCSARSVASALQHFNQPCLVAVNCSICFVNAEVFFIEDSENVQIRLWSYTLVFKVDPSSSVGIMVALTIM